MIISRTPLRISLGGGGTDLKEFYQNEFGAVTSLAINKYIYITINKRFDRSIRICYSQLEITDDVDKIKHNLVREAMKLVGVMEGVEITSVADIPSRGTGLGSSSAFTVGLLNALYSYRGKKVSAARLAEEACKIEIGILKDPIGKQDQYITALGGLRHIRFYPDGKVRSGLINCNKRSSRLLAENLLLFYTGITRDANFILAEQKKDTQQRKNSQSLRAIKKLAIDLKDHLRQGMDAGALGGFLHKNWNEKRKLAGSISSNLIDRYYDRAINAGAIGGKLLGAGGGGFLLFCCSRKHQENLRKALKGLQEMLFKPEPEGTRIIFGG